MLSDNLFLFRFLRFIQHVNMKHFCNLESSCIWMGYECVFFDCDSFILVLKQGTKYSVWLYPDI